MAYCTQCGTKAKKEHNYCSNCGQKLETEKKEKKDIGRRKFLKTLGAGAAGLGLAGMASGLTFKSENGLHFLENGTERLNIDGNGTLNADGLDIGQGRVENLTGENLKLENNTLKADVSGSAGKLSDLTIDGDKDWQGHSISNMESIVAKNVSNEVYAKNFSGGDLASKVENALSWLKDNTGGPGKVRVTPKTGSGKWKWKKEVTIVPEDHKGVQLEIDRNVEIEYTGDGTAITLDGGVNDDQHPEISGGIWSFSGGPDGWLSIQDTYATIVSPTSVNKCYNSSGDAYAVSIENHEAWSETTLIKDCSLQADRAVQFLTADDTGGSGTDSFQETRIQHTTMKGKDYCLKTNGNMRYSKIENCIFRP